MLSFTENPAEYQTAKIALLPLAIEHTTSYKQGTQNAPQAVITASNNLELYDEDLACEITTHLPIHTVPPINNSDSVEKSLDQIYRTASDCISDEKRLVSIGGEHLVTLPLIQAHIAHYGELSVIHLDAHSDFRDTYNGQRLNHATVMRRIWETTGNRILSLGVRAISQEEVDFMRMNQLTHCPIYRNNTTLSDYLPRIQALPNPVYLSIDADGFDPSLVPHVGTPEPGGFNWHECIAFCKALAQLKEVVGFDFVELSPRPDGHASDYLAARLIYKLMGLFWKKPPFDLDPILRYNFGRY